MKRCHSLDPLPLVPEARTRVHAHVCAMLVPGLPVPVSSVRIAQCETLIIPLSIYKQTHSLNLGISSPFKIIASPLPPPNSLNPWHFSWDLGETHSRWSTYNVGFCAAAAVPLVLGRWRLKSHTIGIAARCGPSTEAARRRVESATSAPNLGREEGPADWDVTSCPQWVAQVYSEAARAGPLIRNRHPVEHHRVFTKPSPLFASRTRTPSETQPYYVAVQTTHAFAFYFYSSPARSMQPIAATMGRLRYAFVGAVALSLVLLIIAAPAPANADRLSKRDVKEIAGDLRGAQKEAKGDYKEEKVQLIGDFKSGDMTKSEFKEDLSAARDDYREVAVATKAGLKGLKGVYKSKTDVGDTDALKASINIAIEDPALNPLELVNTIVADIESASTSDTPTLCSVYTCQDPALSLIADPELTAGADDATCCE